MLLAGLPSLAEDEVHDNLDVVIQLGAAAPPASQVERARLGVWRFGADPDDLTSELPIGFWEVLLGHTTVTTELWMRRQAGTPGLPIHRVVTAVAPGSVAHTCMRALWRQTGDMALKLCQVAVAGESGLEGKPAAPSLERRDVPGTLRSVGLWTRHMARTSRRRLQLRGKQFQWHLLVGPAHRDPRGELDVARFRPVPLPADRLWADPFPVTINNRLLVFFEEKLFTEPRGHISVMEMLPDGNCSPPHAVVCRDYHLSYPFVFLWQDQWYMMPESSEAGRVELYRARSFPDEWEFDRVLVQGALVDATVAEINGCWWMFAARMAGPGLPCDDLCLFHAPTPLGPWSRHAMNPVRSDVRDTRPAGRLVYHDGAWWRPTQDGSVRYGYAIRWNRIVRLDSARFEEEPGPVLCPPLKSGVLGIHTINTAGGITLTDALHLIPSGR